jgi:hypothetical protein
MSMKTENEVRNYKKYLEEIIESLNERIDSNTPIVKSTISTIEDEIEVLKCVLNEECNPIGG